MKALSIQQPWAYAILHSGKDIENRDWPTRLRGRVLIHAGKKIDKESIEILEYEYSVLITPDMLVTGGIIGSVEIMDCVTSSKSKWFFGKYGFVLRKPIVLQFMPCRGQLGFFDVEYKKPEDRTSCASEPAQNTAEICHTAPNSASMQNAQLALEL